MAQWRMIPPRKSAPPSAVREDDPREQLLRQMRAIRERIDPAILARAADAATRVRDEQNAQAGAGDRVPYDKQAAQAVVETFLRSRHDGGQFALRLMAALKKAQG